MSATLCPVESILRVFPYLRMSPRQGAATVAIGASCTARTAVRARPYRPDALARLTSGGECLECLDERGPLGKLCRTADEAVCEAINR